MGLFDWFRSAPLINDRASLADFIDTRAAFLTQKSIFDYVRGRAGPYFSIIINEEEFKANLEEGRWKSYPFALSVVTELVYSVLVPLTGRPVELAAKLRDVALEVFDRYPVPPALNAGHWKEARRELAIRCEQISLHPPKLPADMPVPVAKVFFDNMPIHEKLRQHDFVQITNQLRANTLSMHGEFLKQADLPALAAALNLPSGSSAD
jgi:hypothetical protein